MANQRLHDQTFADEQLQTSRDAAHLTILASLSSPSNIKVDDLTPAQIWDIDIEAEQLGDTRHELTSSDYKHCRNGDSEDGK